MPGEPVVLCSDGEISLPLEVLFQEIEEVNIHFRRFENVFFAPRNKMELHCRDHVVADP